MNKGKLIVFEGPDMSGKTTLIKSVKEYYKNLGKKVIITREPGGLNNNITEQIRNVLLNNKNTIAPITEALLYAASRAEHCNMLKEILKKDVIVLCDRFVFSSYVYQGIQIGESKVRAMNAAAINGIDIDAIILLNFNSYDDYYKRKQESMKNGKKLDRIEMKSNEFFKNVIICYANQSFYPYKDVLRLDASLSREKIKNNTIDFLNKIVL